jgi:hypothetical protein
MMLSSDILDEQPKATNNIVDDATMEVIIFIFYIPAPCF